MATLRFNYLAAALLFITWTCLAGVNSLAVADRQQQQQDVIGSTADEGAPDDSAPKLKLLSTNLHQAGGNGGPDGWMYSQKQRQLLADPGMFELPGLHNGASDESGNDGSKPSLGRQFESRNSWASRKLRQFVTNSRSDRITHAMAAAQAAIATAVNEGAGRSATRAASKGMEVARLTTKVSSKPWEFARRRLLQAPTNSRSDRISQALSAAQDAIGRAVASGATLRDARGAANTNLAYAKMTTQPATDPWQFGRRK